MKANPKGGTLAYLLVAVALTFALLAVVSEYMRAGQRASAGMPAPNVVQAHK